MPRVTKLEGTFPFRVSVLLTEVTFDKEGKVDVSEEIARVFRQVPGYVVGEDAPSIQAEQAEPVAQVVEAPTEGATDFRSLHWKKQKSLIDGGEIDAGGLQKILESDYSEPVKKAAMKQLSKL